MKQVIRHTKDLGSKITREAYLWFSTILQPLHLQEKRTRVLYQMTKSVLCIVQLLFFLSPSDRRSEGLKKNLVHTMQRLHMQVCDEGLLRPELASIGV